MLPCRTIQIIRMSMSAGTQRQLIERILSSRIGCGKDAPAIAAATARLWNELHLQLAPLVGIGGVRAIYARTLHLARAEFPWLADAREFDQRDLSFGGLKACLEKREAEEAAAASGALLRHFGDLLSTLIGELLAESLLRAAWKGEDRGEREQEPKA